MRHRHSEYMQWAKTQSRARFNLATSGVGPFPLREMPFDFSALEINGDNTYGYAPLKNAINALSFHSFVKTALQFKRKFWEEDEQIFGGITSGDAVASSVTKAQIQAAMPKG